MTVILPEAGQGIGVAGGPAEVDPYASPLPVLYLLHGLSDDHSIWLRRTAIDRHVANRRLAVVMPQVHRSFYCDMVHGPRFWTFMTDDLPGACRRFFPISGRREDTFAAGLSMGGFGAFKLAIHHPERFAAVASLSGAIDMATRCARKADDGDDPLWIAEKQDIFGPLDEVAGSDNDLVARLDRLAALPGPRRPRLYQCVGTEDFLIEDNRRFRERADTLGVELTYEEHDGRSHEWAYWDQQIVRVLDWMEL